MKKYVYGIKEDQNRPRKKHTPEEIVAKLRQVDVLVSHGTPVSDAVRQIGVSEVTYYRWRQEDEEQLTDDLVALVREHGRLGYRKMAALLRSTSGWVVNDKRVERIWRQEGLKVPPRQPKRSRTWPSDGACPRLRAERPNHVWFYDFVADRTHDGRKYRMLNVVDEFTRQCLAIRINRKLKSSDVIDVLSELFILRGVQGHIRSDNAPEFVAKALQEWIAAVGAKTAYIEPGSPWENGCIKSFNVRLRDELLNGEIFYTLAEARIVIESWRRFYNTRLPHGLTCP